jgi:hypothetical protein
VLEDVAAHDYGDAHERQRHARPEAAAQHSVEEKQRAEADPDRAQVAQERGVGRRREEQRRVPDPQVAREEKARQARAQEEG